MPFWDISRDLEELSFKRFYRAPFEETHVNFSEQVSEQDESTLASFQLPTELPTDKGGILELHNSIATHTIIAAARGGKLKQLAFNGHIQRPFAVRALLPYWVRLDEWNIPGYRQGYMAAAPLLRPLLAHASLWLGTAEEHEDRHDRRLTREEIQTLKQYCESHGVPKLRQPLAFLEEEDEDQDEEGHQELAEEQQEQGSKTQQAKPEDPNLNQPIELYLPWLEDAELAQQVANAWNAIAERGEADLVKCECEKCAASE